jgi:hypothetical protein
MLYATFHARITDYYAQSAVFLAISIAENQTGFSTCLLKAKNTYHPMRKGASNNRCLDSCRAITIELKCKRPNGSHFPHVR